jgi:hypothetical protein
VSDAGKFRKPVPNSDASGNHRSDTGPVSQTHAIDGTSLASRKLISALGLTLGGDFGPKSRHQPNQFGTLGQWKSVNNDSYRAQRFRSAPIIPIESTTMSMSQVREHL